MRRIYVRGLGWKAEFGFTTNPARAREYAPEVATELAEFLEGILSEKVLVL